MQKNVVEYFYTKVRKAADLFFHHPTLQNFNLAFYQEVRVQIHQTESCTCRVDK